MTSYYAGLAAGTKNGQNLIENVLLIIDQTYISIFILKFWSLDYRTRTKLTPLGRTKVKSAAKLTEERADVASHGAAAAPSAVTRGRRRAPRRRGGRHGRRPWSPALPHARAVGRGGWGSGGRALNFWEQWEQKLCLIHTIYQDQHNNMIIHHLFIF